MKTKHKGVISVEAIFSITLLTIFILIAVSMVLFSLKHTQLLLNSEFSVDKVSVRSTCKFSGKAIDYQCLKRDLDDEISKNVTKKNNISFSSSIIPTCTFTYIASKAKKENCFWYIITFKQKILGLGVYSFKQSYISSLEKLSLSTEGR